MVSSTPRAKVSLSTDRLGRTQVQGVYETRRALMAMGMERNEFEKWIKESAIITARHIGRRAPVLTGKLATSIRGYASKKVSYAKNEKSKRVFGGVVVSSPKAARPRTHRDGSPVNSDVFREYGRRISFGYYNPRTKKRTRPNPFMRDGRNSAKPTVVRFWSGRIENWIRKKGFDTNGF